MRIDKELLESFSHAKKPTLRIYSWEKSFTYGVSQKMEDLQSFANLQSFEDNHAQRLTGGGILFHGNDISYSIVVPTSYFPSLNVKESYELLCTFLLDFYTNLGLEPHYAKDLASIELARSEFCQEGYEPYDIIISGKKIGGNAQRRTKEVIFQHGSINIDNTYPFMGTSLEDLDVKISYKQAQKKLIESFAEAFNVVYEEDTEELVYAP